MNRPTRDALRCSRCGSAVRRVHRTEADTAEGPGSGWRRYACLDEGCGWQGLLSRQGAASRGSGATDPSRTERRSRRAARSASLPSRRRLWAVAGGLLLLVAAMAGGVAMMALRADPGTDALAAPGSRPLDSTPAAPSLQPRR